ncbi:MAG: S41 family peptidase [Phycisphaeraceae bacterium]
MSSPHGHTSPLMRIVSRYALLVVVLLLVVNVATFLWVGPYGLRGAMSPVGQAYSNIQRYFVGEVDEQALLDAALKGMADALGDENTSYLSPEELSFFKESVGGAFTGIGAEIDLHEERLRIVAPLDDSPAWRAGVLPGDIVLSIDGEDTLGIDLFDAMKRLKGEEGTTVEIRVRHRDGTIADLTITRGVIQVASVKGFRREFGNGYDYMLDPIDKIAYLRLTQFGETSYEEVEATLRSLKARGMAALILDLRDNGGGLLDGAVGIADLFLTGGQTIVSTKGKSAANDVIESTDQTLLPDLPLVVLINGNSASASEIVAGAMADNGRALLVGTRTFGKGSVQQLIPLGDKRMALKLTTAYWYLPSGKMIHRKPGAASWGVDPSPGCFVPMEPDALRAMLMKRRESEVNDPYASLDGAVTPTWLREVMLDEPLAAGLAAAKSYLNSGRWPAVGVSAEIALAEPTEREQLERRRKELVEMLEAVDEEIEQLAEQPAMSDALIAQPVEGD